MELDCEGRACYNHTDRSVNRGALGGNVNQRSRGEETRSRILEVAQESFAQQGYDATGVAEICRRAGVTKGAFYYHFPSKQALFLELLDRWLEGVDEELMKARIDATNVPEELSQMAGRIRHVFYAASGQLPIFLEFWTQAVHDPEVWQATVAPYRRYQKLFADMIADGIAEGSLRQIDPQIAAQVIVSLAVGLVLQGALDPEGSDWGEVTEEGVRMLLEGLERRD